eukprot:gene36828-48027_t
MEVLLQQIINGLVLGSMYALVALGYTMVYGIIGLINFAHGDVLMVGALTSWTIIGVMQDATPGMPGWLVLLLAVIIAMVVCATLNYTIEKLAYRPLRNSSRLAPLITAMGMSLLLQTLAMIVWKPNPKPFPPLLSQDPIFLWADGPVISVTQILILVTTVVVLAFLLWLVNRTKLGRAMRATAENPRVAGLMGVQPDHIISATFVIGATLAAIAGLMWAANYGTVQHTMGFLPGLKAFTAAVFATFITRTPCAHAGRPAAKPRAPRPSPKSRRVNIAHSFTHENAGMPAAQAFTVRCEASAGIQCSTRR